jgi:hypothetical protein
MKKFDTLDSLKHLNFPDATAKEKRDKFGSFALSIFGLLGLLIAINNPDFNFTKNDTVKREKVNKFWLTPAALNAEKTALNSTLTTNSTLYKKYASSDTAAKQKLNY